MSGNFITTEITGSILTVTFNRPDKMNAITGEMYGQLIAAYQQLDNDDNLKVAVIKGTEKAFTAGNDLEDFLAAEGDVEEGLAFAYIQQMIATQKPVVAAVSGLAIGIGTTLLMHCDLVYADDTALFKMPFTHLGLCPEAASSYLMPNFSGYQKAFEYLVLGEAFNAQQGYEIGLVNKVVTEGTVYEHAMSQAERLAQLPAEAVARSKALIKHHHQGQRLEAANAEIKDFGELLQTDTSKAIIGKFLNK